MTKFASYIHRHWLNARCALALCLAFILAGATLVSARHQNPPARQNQPAANTAETASQRIGEIAGRVVSEDGQPIFNARINASMVGRANQGARSTGTDAEGNFRLTDLPPAAYTLFVSAPGYVTPFSSAQAAEAPVYRIGESATITLAKGSVITGRVTDANGEPIPSLTVRAFRVRDAEGRSVAPALTGRDRPTDDRGIYRLYGLAPGTYIVMAAGLNRVGRPSEHEGEAPTFHPSATRDTAVEVTVRGGEEASGIDIRFRAERGHVVSGTVTGAAAPAGAPPFAMIELRHAVTGTIINSTSAQLSDARRGFAIYGVPDGEYEVTAQRPSGGPNDPDAHVSLPRRISVKGADVTGVELTLIGLASIAGRIVLEPASPGAAPCEDKRPSHLVETLLTTRRADQAAGENELLQRWIASTAAPNDQGEFTLRNLVGARYRVEARLPSENWYVKTMTTPGPASSRQTVDAGRAGLALRSGERATGLTITLAEGAASVRGKITPGEGAKLPSRLRVHLVPAERERADDVLRYAQVNASSDGSFTVTNLAPGKYWLLARPISDDETTAIAPRPAAWDNTERAKLRREAEAAKVELELQPCQRVNDFALRFAATASSK
jgi:hypothetical protein